MLVVAGDSVFTEFGILLPDQWAWTVAAALAIPVWARALGVIVPANARLGALLYTLGRMVEEVGDMARCTTCVAGMSARWCAVPSCSDGLHVALQHTQMCNRSMFVSSSVKHSPCRHTSIQLPMYIQPWGCQWAAHEYSAVG
jgi:hypothetical protein